MSQEVWKQARPILTTRSGELISLEISSHKAVRFSRGGETLKTMRGRKVVDLPAVNGVMKCVSVVRAHKKLFPELY